MIPSPMHPDDARAVYDAVDLIRKYGYAEALNRVKWCAGTSISDNDRTHWRTVAVAIEAADDHARAVGDPHPGLRPDAANAVRIADAMVQQFGARPAWCMAVREAAFASSHASHAHWTRVSDHIRQTHPAAPFGTDPTLADDATFPDLDTLGGSDSLHAEGT